MIEKIISGGQTGVDRAALDAAMAAGLPHGGWCPRGRKAEDGSLGNEYKLTETPRPDYSQRTEWNVRDADATLILGRGRLEGGTALTAKLARQYRKPCLVADLQVPPPMAEIRAWLQANNVCSLNVAGPRESKQPGIYEAAREFLERLLARSD